MKIYTIPSELLPKLESKIEQNKKKLNKYGKLEYTVSNPYLKEFTDKDNPNKVHGVTVVDVNIEASYKVGNYEFVASCEWIEESKSNIIKKLSEDIYVPEVYRSRCKCDHCKSNRQRKYTIILRNTEDGNYIQVGKGCCKDFIGYDIGSYANYLSFFETLEEFEDFNNKDFVRFVKPLFKVREIIEQTYCDIKNFGYISKNNQLENGTESTSSRIWKLFVGGAALDNRALKFEENISAEIHDAVNNLYDYYAQLDSDNDFIHSLKTVINDKVIYIESDKIGLVVAAVGTKIRHEKLSEKQIKEINLTFGEDVGTKIEFQCKPERVGGYETEYGWINIYKMIANNHCYIWKTGVVVETEKVVTIKGTVKAWEWFGNTKQTILTRCKVLCEV